MKKNNLNEIKVLDAQQMNAIQGGKAPKFKIDEHYNDEPDEEIGEEPTPF